MWGPTLWRGGRWGPRGFRGVSKRVQLDLGVSPARKPGRFSPRFETRSEAWMRVGVRDADRAPRNPFERVTCWQAICDPSYFRYGPLPFRADRMRVGRDWTAAQEDRGW